MRVEEAFMLGLPADARSVFDEEAAVDDDVEPRGGSLPCVAWNRDNVVFAGAAGESCNARSIFIGVGVVDGEIKATFFCTSLIALPFFREVRPAESGSSLGEAARLVASVEMVADDVVRGSGAGFISGRGLKETGVEFERCISSGGHGLSGGNFSL